MSHSRYELLLKARKEELPLDETPYGGGVRVTLREERYFIPTLLGVIAQTRSSHPEISFRDLLMIVSNCPMAAIAVLVWSDEILTESGWVRSPVKSLELTEYTDSIVANLALENKRRYQTRIPIAEVYAYRISAEETEMVDSLTEDDIIKDLMPRLQDIRRSTSLSLRDQLMTVFHTALRTTYGYLYQKHDIEKADLVITFATGKSLRIYVSRLFPPTTNPDSLSYACNPAATTDGAFRFNWDLSTNEVFKDGQWCETSIDQIWDINTTTFSLERALAPSRTPQVTRPSSGGHSDDYQRQTSWCNRNTYLSTILDIEHPPYRD